MTSASLRILVVEDNAALRANIAALLEAHGHQADFAADGRAGLRMALESPPDVLVLDVGLPGIDGLQVCAGLRARADRHVPVLMLTARDAIDDKLRGFDVGADDYLVKPFAGEELLARCLALSRRHQAGARHVIEIGSLRIDRRSCEVERAGRRIELAMIPYRILLALAEHWPQVLTRSDLHHLLWDGDVPRSDPLRSHLYALRVGLDRPFERPMLITVHGVGFRLEADT